jgi:hypothetical protein
MAASWEWARLAAGGAVLLAASAKLLPGVSAATEFFDAATHCFADCPVGQYKENCVSLSSLGYCADCSGAPAGYYYTGQGEPNEDNCAMTECAACDAGLYRDGCGGTSPGTCEQCTTSMVGYFYTGDGGLADACPIAACSNAPAESGTGLTYFYTDDGTDAACLASDSAIPCEYATSDCAYEVCEDTTVCPAGQYLLGCAGNSSGACVPCTNVFDTVTDDDSAARTRIASYYTGAGATADDPESCPLQLCAFDCPVGTYRAGCSGADAGSCQPCMLRDGDTTDDQVDYFVAWTTVEHVHCENWDNAANLLGVFDTSAECREFCAPSADCSACTFYCETDQNTLGGTFRALRMCGEEEPDSSDACGSVVDYYGSPMGKDACPTAACVADCPVGEYRSSCGGTSEGECVACTNAPALDGDEQYMCVRACACVRLGCIAASSSDTHATPRGVACGQVRRRLHECAQHTRTRLPACDCAHSPRRPGT